MKVKFFANYDRSEILLNRFKANYDIYDDELSYTTGDEYDLLWCLMPLMNQ